MSIYYLIYVNNKNDYLKLQNIQKKIKYNYCNKFNYDEIYKVKFTGISQISKLMLLDCYKIN